MKQVIVVLSLLTLVWGVPELISNLQNVDGLEEWERSEEAYVKRFVNDLQFLIGEESELEDDPDEEQAEEEITLRRGDLESLPEELDWRDKGVMHAAIYQGVGCGSCGWVSGTQTLEARIAIVSENYIPYSIQNFMNCAGKPCVGVQPYAVTTQVKKSGFIVPEEEIPYTKKQCLKEGDGKSACYAKCGAMHPNRFSNSLRDQFVIIAGTGKASSEEHLIKALQDGPVTTCYHLKSVEEGERCSSGCQHANSVVGYTPDKWILQDSYGKDKFEYNDGSWRTSRGSECGTAIINKAHFPRIFYDYDRANAYYTPVEGGVREEELEFVDREIYGVTDADGTNVGTAKNKCAFLGSACKGVVALSSGSFGLVSNFGAGTHGDQIAFRKVQMVIYLKHEESGRYIGIQQIYGKLEVTSVHKDKAAPFFTSYSRFISFQYPTYHLVDNKMELIVGGVEDIDEAQSWTLNNCNIYNDASGNSFDLISGDLLGGKKADLTSTTQRFNIGLSGNWTIVSSKLKLPLVEGKKKSKTWRRFSEDKKASIVYFRWNARQIISDKGHPFNSNMELSEADFKFEDQENTMRPRYCGISKLQAFGIDDHLAMENNKVVMSSTMDSSWTIEHGDL